jgi:hypothetical protein
VVVAVVLRVPTVVVAPQMVALEAVETAAPLLMVLTEQPILAAAQVVGGTQQTH